MKPANTNDGGPNYQATEIVYINSSPPLRIGLPVARVLKRRDGYYMRPRSPVSPSSSERSIIPTSIPNPGRRAERIKRDFVRTKGTTL